MDDPFVLERFVHAQRGVYEVALAELRAGRKTTHWMWFIFPQLEGLGSSLMATRYGVTGLPEARAYLAHPVLGPRLIECVEAVLGVTGASAQVIFSSPDHLKFRSSLTLFAAAAPWEVVFTTALDTYFGGVRDPVTAERLRKK
jgi:uncharacterized protein (DUF1810 family)